MGLETVPTSVANQGEHVVLGTYGTMQFSEFRRQEGLAVFTRNYYRSDNRNGDHRDPSTMGPEARNRQGGEPDPNGVVGPRKCKAESRLHGCFMEESCLAQSERITRGHCAKGN